MTNRDCPTRALIKILFGIVLLHGAAAWAQAPVPPAAEPPAAPAQPADPAAPPPTRPGFIDAFGKLIEQSVTNMSTTLGKMNENAKDANDAAKSAAEAAGTATKEAVGAAGGLVLLPVSRMVAGREACAIAPNGAPDCAGAVAKLCKANGFSVGRSMDMESAEVCPNSVLIARRYGQPAPELCKTESFVTKVLCQ